jgi:hypothetical protein
MIKEIVVTNASGESLPMSLTTPDSAGFIVLGVEGLDPGKSVINVRDNASTDGSTFNSAKDPTRNIVISLLFLEGMSTIEAARLRTYRYFPNKSRVRIDVTTDADTYYIYGYVESNEVAIFSKNEGCVISILCPSPYFKTADGTRSGTVEGVIPLFHFPFANLVGEKTIIFGMRFFQQEFVINVPYGVENVGPTLILHADGGRVNNPRIYFRNPNNPNEVQSLGFAFTDNLPPLEDGDYLAIVCERQNKSVTRFIANAAEGDPSYVNYIGAVAYGSIWPMLHPWDNSFSYEADSDDIDATITPIVGSDLDIPVSIMQYAGVITPMNVSLTDTGDHVGHPAHGLANDTPIEFSKILTTTGILVNKVYYVVNATTDTFQVAATVGGAAIHLTKNGAGTLKQITNSLIAVAHGLSNGTPVTLPSIGTATGIVVDTTYYVVNATTNKFQLAATSGGDPLTITAGGSGTVKLVGNIVVSTAHGMLNGAKVVFSKIVSTTGISTNVEYFVVNKTANTFQVALGQNGSPLTMTTNGSGTYRKVGVSGAYIRFEYSYGLQYAGV